MPAFINKRLSDLVTKDDLLLIFTHAQRTGGNTFRKEVLTREFGRDAVYTTQYVPGYRKLQYLTDEDLANYKVYTGHSNYRKLTLHRTCLFVSLIRHPLYRAVSLYFYCKRKEGHVLRDLANRESLENFYAEGTRQAPSYFKNTMCLRVGGRASADIAIEAMRKSYIGVGFTDTLEDFANELGRIFRWPQFHIASRENDAERYEKLVTDEFREKVLDDNQEDLKLYSAVMAGIE